jgi:Stress up-regulated Nod 19
VARVVALLVALIALGSALPAASEARPRTFHLRYGPVDLRPAELKWSTRPVHAPAISGLITRMHAYVTDRRGRRLASTQVMLHHAVFRRLIKPRWDQDCGRMRDAEPFYATGEENETLRLPDGYGISTHTGSQWRVRWMLMNHTDRPQRAFISYTVRVDQSPLLQPVVPLWLRVVDCDHDQFRVPGGGGPGSVFTTGRTIAARAGGWIVAATGHLHAGALGLSLSQPACGGRELIKTQPVYAKTGLTPTDGPVHVTGFASTPGIPVAAGEPLSLTATYDNSIARDDVMGTMHLYLRPALGIQQTCPPLPGAQG